MSTENLTTYATLAALALLLVWKLLQHLVDIAGGPEWGALFFMSVLAVAVAAICVKTRLANAPPRSATGRIESVENRR